MPNEIRSARDAARYWKDRKAQDEHVFGEVERMVRREKDACKEIEGIYKRAFDELDKELDALKKDVGKEAVTNAQMQKPLTPQELREWSKRQEKRLDDLIRKYGDEKGRQIFGIENAKSAKQDRANRVVRRNTALRESIESISSGAAADSESEVSKRLTKEAEIGAEIGEEQMKKAFDGQLRTDFNTASEREIERIKKTVWNGDDYSGRVWANRDEMVKDLKKTIELGVTNGWSVDRMRKEMERHVASGAKSAERIVRTEMNRVSNSSELSFYKDNGVKFYMFMATEDARVCEICGGMNEKVFAVEDAAAGLNFPPMHPNCRCRTVVSTVDSEGKDDDSWLDDLAAEADEMFDDEEDHSDKKHSEPIRNTIETGNEIKKTSRKEDLKEAEKSGSESRSEKPNSSDGDFSGRENLNDLYPEKDNHTKCFNKEQVSAFERRLRKANKDIKLTPEDLPSIALYVDGGYKMLNSLERDESKVKREILSYNENYEAEMTLQLLKYRSEKLSEEIQKFTLPESVTVKRLLKDVEFLNVSPSNKRNLQRLVGKTFVDKGFVSASIDLNYNGTFGAGSSNKVVMYIDVPAGAKAAYVSGISRKYKKQKELLIDKMTKFLITQAGERVAGVEDGKPIKELFIHAKVELNHER